VVVWAAVAVSHKLEHNTAARCMNQSNITSSYVSNMLLMCYIGFAGGETVFPLSVHRQSVEEAKKHSGEMPNVAYNI
jgi:hypothetical protein